MGLDVWFFFSNVVGVECRVDLGGEGDRKTSMIKHYMGISPITNKII